MRSIKTATDFAEAIIAGEIEAGKPERDACARHLSDLKRKDVYYDYDLEKKVFAFIESLFLDLGIPFVLLPWQIFVTGCILCWKWTKTGLRRFRRVYIETSKGSGKSPLVAAIMLHMIVNTKSNLINKGLFAGATEKQAGVAFKDLVSLVRNSEDLKNILTVQGRSMPNKVWSPTTLAEIECIPYKAGAAGLSGVRPLCSVVDEYHEHSADTTLRMLEQSEKRPDSLLLVVTNAGPNKKVPCWEEHELALKVAEGKGSDTRFAYVAMCDPGEDPFTSLNPMSFLRKANPGLPMLPIGRDFLADIEDARGSESRMNSFRRLYASQWISDTSAYIDPNIWESREGKLSAKSRRKKARAYIGVDLSLKGDLTSAAIVWAFPRKWEAEVASWTPEGRLMELSHSGQIRPEWIKKGWLKTCPGRTIRFADIARWIREMCKEYDVQGVAFDPSRFSEVEIELKRLGVLCTRDRFGDGLFLVPHSQQAKPPKGASEEYQETPRLWLGRSLEDLECAVLDGTITYERNDTLRAANEGCAIKTDEMDWRHPSKKDSSWKIDPVIALMMACGYAAWTRHNDNMSPAWDAIDKFAKAFES